MQHKPRAKYLNNNNEDKNVTQINQAQTRYTIQ